jgi:hypothetical protein
MISWRHTVTKDEALNLQSMVDGFLEDAKAAKEIDGAINWADLRCVDVQESLLDDTVTITIEEADPSAEKLCRYVAERLRDNGYPDIIVRTEW